MAEVGGVVSCAVGDEDDVPTGRGGGAGGGGWEGEVRRAVKLRGIREDVLQDASHVG